MGFGQYMGEDTRTSKDLGYPVPRGEVKYGRMTLDEIMADLDSDPILSSAKSAHNEVTITYKNGSIVCRLRETNIVYLHPNGAYHLDTGGWNTPTTKRHMVNFLARHGFPISLWGDKKRGGIILRDHRGNAEDTEILFKKTATVFGVGDFLVDDQVRG